MNKAEFDQFADEYYAQHAKNITLSGRMPEFFAEYKILETSKIIEKYGIPARRILDFGSGIGNSVPWFRKYFPESELICADISQRSIELSKQRLPGNETYLKIDNNSLGLPDCSMDLIFSACVFHHIPQEEHGIWFKELHRVLKVGGFLVIFEHNPLNPLTVSAVNKCPFDKNAVLINARKLRRSAELAGWKGINTTYHIFFPRVLAVLRPLEKLLRRICVGAQYCFVARKL